MPAMLAHGLAAAHADRVQELAHLYGRLELTVTADGVDGDAARSAHHALSARVREWVVADEEGERRDVVELAGDEREAMLHEIVVAIPYARVTADGSSPTEEADDVIRSLEQMRLALPPALPRAALIRFRRSAARLERLVALGAPAVIIANEPRLLVRAIQRAIEPIDPPQIPFRPARGFQDTLFWALDACVISEPGASRPANLGLGASLAVAALLGVSGESTHELHGRWVELAPASHPFARYPFVPRGRFCRTSRERFVRPDFEETGPIGWAAGDDVAALARDLGTVADGDSVFAPELQAVSHRLEAVSLRGDAVIGLIEYLSPEADGEMSWFAATGTDDG